MAFVGVSLEAYMMPSPYLPQVGTGSIGCFTVPSPPSGLVFREAKRIMVTILGVALF